MLAPSHVLKSLICGLTMLLSSSKRQRCFRSACGVLGLMMRQLFRYLSCTWTGDAPWIYTITHIRSLGCLMPKANLDAPLNFSVNGPKRKNKIKSCRSWVFYLVCVWRWLEKLRPSFPSCSHCHWACGPFNTALTCFSQMVNVMEIALCLFGVFSCEVKQTSVIPHLIMGNKFDVAFGHTYSISSSVVVFRT